MTKFKKVYIEITNICNLQCSFCPQTKREKENMSLEVFTEILDQIKPYTDYIYLHVKGEPLLHPNIDELLDISYEKDFKVNLTSNASLIRKKKAKIINKPALRQINFSLHSFDGNYDKDKYAKEREEYFQDVFDFIKERRKSQPIVSLRLWNLQDRIEEACNQDILRLIEEEFNLDYNIADVFKPDEGIKLGPRVYLNQDYEFKWPDLKEEEDDGRGFCYALRDQVAILVDGTVVPCCLDGEGVINLGNIHDSSFRQIINSNRAKAIYNGFSQRRAVEELCRKCGYRQRFGK